MGIRASKVPLWQPFAGNAYDIPTHMVGPQWNRDNMLCRIYPPITIYVRELEKAMYNDRRAIMIHTIGTMHYWTHCGLVPYNPNRTEYSYIMMLTANEHLTFTSFVNRRITEMYNAVTNPTAVIATHTSHIDTD
jgi:hypothetical protein